MTSLKWMIIFVALAGCDGKVNPRSTQLNESENPAGKPPQAGVKQVNAGLQEMPANDDAEADRPEGPIRPDYSKAVLTAASRSVSAIRSQERWPSEHLVGKSLIRIRDATIESLDNITGNREWTTQSQAGPGLGLRWLGHHNGALFFAEIRSHQSEDEERAVPLTGIRRLRLRDGVWLKPFMVPLDDDERTRDTKVSAILGTDEGIFALSNTRDTADFLTKNRSYRVTRFTAGSSGVVWSKSYESAGTVPNPHAFVLGGGRGSARDTAAIQGLTRLGSHVLICGGPLEDLIAIDPTDGETVWRIPRLWEIQRGFIGPSVWQHFLGRYSVEKDDLEVADLTLEELRAKNKNQDETGFFMSEDYFEELKTKVQKLREQTAQRQGTITAGPVVVGGFDEEHSARVFVVTAQTMNSDWPAYLSDCVCYELDKDGNAIGIVTLPRFVKGSIFSVVNNSIAWQCERDGLARLFPSPDDGTSDRIIDLEWRVNREKKDDQNKPWFQNGGWTNEIAQTANSFIRVQNGGFVETSESNEYQFRFEEMNLLTNQKFTFQLRVPFKGKFDPPSNNYSRSEGKDGAESWISYSWFPIAIVGLEVRGDRLVVNLENEKTRHSLEFNLKAILAGQ